MSVPQCCLLLALACACGDDALGAGPDRMLNPGEVGPYAVGVTTREVCDPNRVDPRTGQGQRCLPLEIWYPADEASRDGDRDVVDLLSDAPDDIRQLMTGIVLPTHEQPAVRDAEPRMDQGRYPVLLFSHGNAGIRYQSYIYTAHLASHGYVVIAPDHVGNTVFEEPLESKEQDEVADLAMDRPRDLTLILDRIEAGELLADIADLENVGATGHSFGGLTSLLISNSLGFFWDRRVTAVVPLAPVTSALDLLVAPPQSADAPIFYVAGDRDLLAPPDAEVSPAYQANPVAKGYALLHNVGHFGFADWCDEELWTAAERLGYSESDIRALQNGCGPEFADEATTDYWVNYFGTAWFNTYLRASEDTARAYLHDLPPNEQFTLLLSR